MINYTTSFPDPHSVREEWDRIAGFPEVFTGEGFGESLTAVQDGLGANQEHGAPSARDQIMEKGLRTWAGTSTSSPAMWTAARG